MPGLDDIDKNIMILVADDYALTRDMLRSILKQYGFTNVLAVEDGRRALDKVREGGVDLVICDWNMPGMSGLEVLRALRADQRFKKLKFIMLTAEAYRENVMEAIKAGVSDYMSKPFTAATLAEKLENIFCQPPKS